MGMQPKKEYKTEPGPSSNKLIVAIVLVILVGLGILSYSNSGNQKEDISTKTLYDIDDDLKEFKNPMIILSSHTPYVVDDKVIEEWVESRTDEASQRAFITSLNSINMFSFIDTKGSNSIGGVIMESKNPEFTLNMFKETSKEAGFVESGKKKIKGIEVTIYRDNRRLDYVFSIQNWVFGVGTGSDEVRIKDAELVESLANYFISKYR